MLRYRRVALATAPVHQSLRYAWGVPLQGGSERYDVDVDSNIVPVRTVIPSDCSLLLEECTFAPPRA
jgi:hypothetical protein